MYYRRNKKISMSLSRRAAGSLVAGFLTLGVIGVSALALRNQVQADTLVAGYATAHVHLEVMVCNTPQLPLKTTFTPESGKKFYFKERTFDLSPGLNTIEWYIRKIPGTKVKAQLTSSQGIVAPESQDVVLESDKVSETIKYSIFICEPTPTPTPVPTATPAPIQTSVPLNQGTQTPSGGGLIAPPVPAAPEKPSVTNSQTATVDPLSPPSLI